MKTLLFTIAISLVSTELSAQTKDSTFQYVEVEGGTTIPIGNLKNTMNVAPHVGLWIRQPYTQHSIWSFGFNFNFPKSTTIQYVNDDFETKTKSFSGVVGFRLDKSFPIHNEKKIDLVWSSIMGYGFYFFDDVRARAVYERLPPSKQEKEDKPIYIKPFGTVHIAQGVQLRIRDMGIHARYNYAPYSIFSDIIDHRFGAHSISIGLSYRQ